jgi:6-pyruvoyltetrahydropterin/6-carboxytetrahydropterin synthase
MSQFSVNVSKDYLVFPAAHFITYRGLCEPLHGHNYRASVTVEGELDDNHYVLDFVLLKKMMRDLIDELDHRMLLARDNTHMEITEEPGSVTVQYEERRYVFPREDVVILPIPNTTAEMIGRYLTGKLRERLAAEGHDGVTAIIMEVEESFGQAARYREPVD